MATLVEPSGSLSLSALFQHVFSEDTDGNRSGSITFSRSFQCDEALPDIIGMCAFIRANEITCANGEWHLADPDDLFQGMGDAKMHDDLTTVGKKLKCLIVKASDDNEGTITIRVPASNGCPVLKGTTPGYDIKPGSLFFFLDPTGEITGALARGTNDILNIEVAGGAATAEVLIVVSD